MYIKLINTLKPKLNCKMGGGDLNRINTLTICIQISCVSNDTNCSQ